MTSREELIYMTKLTEQTERFEDGRLTKAATGVRPSAVMRWRLATSPVVEPLPMSPSTIAKRLVKWLV